MDMTYVKEPPEPDYDSLRHDRYDVVTKDALRKFPDDILRTVLERPDFQFEEFLDSEFATVDVRRMDNLVKARLDDDEVLVHIEFQVGDSTPLDMARRNVGYLGRCYEKYGLPILSHVIYLRPDAGRNDPGGYRQDLPNHRFIVEYKVIRLVEFDGQSVFDTENLGLTPFAPLMKPPVGIDGLQWAIQCNERTKALALPTDIRSNLLVSQWIMSGLIHPQQAISDFFSEEVMQESSFFQYLDETRGKEQYQLGIQQGEKRKAIRNLFEVLEFRFDGLAVRAIRPALENIHDLRRLEELFQEALGAETLEDFTRALDTNRDDE